MPALTHPLVDGSGPGFVHSETRARVVALTPLRADLFLRAGAAGLRVVLVSDEQTRLTDAYRDIMTIAGGVWVVRSTSGLRDGISGRALSSLESILETPNAGDVVAPRFANLEQPDQVQFAVSASIRHRADEGTRLGRAAEVLAALGGASSPRWWGTSEPCDKTWNKDTLTTAIRDRMPADTRLIITGDDEHPMLASLLGRRTNRGVEEVFTGLIGVGEPGSPEVAQAFEAAPSVLASLTAEALPLVATVFTRVGRKDLTTRPFVRQDPEPVALLLGAPAVRDLGLDPAAMQSRFGAITAGRPRVPALVFPFRDDPADRTGGWPRAAAVIDDLGPDRLEKLTGVTYRRAGEA
ncbi:DUF6177 family protein [Frondihabitans sp. VKM Ac-2883]|uniref:DUF6177 family protein n=1 Tax=Frondihabitans sp. VKM Ac-2883 TaxID=2783823 RepID=UPI00188C1D77|nr:hypothetical protein [Frondihabitans sp. VKM Ac-2883]